VPAGAARGGAARCAPGGLVAAPPAARATSGSARGLTESADCAPAAASLALACVGELPSADESPAHLVLSSVCPPMIGPGPWAIT
jgi:hypothetical protein